MNKITEDQIQAQVIKWWSVAHRGLRVPFGCLLYHIPNGAYFGAGEKVLRGGKTVKLGAIRAARMKRQGLVSGIPDLKLAVCRVYKNRFYGGLYIEMKKKGGRTSDAQKEVHPALIWAGYSVEVAYSFDEAVDAIVDYLSGAPISLSPPPGLNVVIPATTPDNR